LDEPSGNDSKGNRTFNETETLFSDKEKSVSESNGWAREMGNSGFELTRSPGDTPAQLNTCRFLSSLLSFLLIRGAFMTPEDDARLVRRLEGSELDALEDSDRLTCRLGDVIRDMERL
jgi:hypothetical protein